jgi:hypothetical protein
MFGQQGGVLSCETGPWMADVDGGIPEKKGKGKKKEKLGGTPGLSVTGGAGRSAIETEPMNGVRRLWGWFVRVWKVEGVLGGAGVLQR